MSAAILEEVKEYEERYRVQIGTEWFTAWKNEWKQPLTKGQTVDYEVRTKDNPNEPGKPWKKIVPMRKVQSQEHPTLSGRDIMNKLDQIYQKIREIQDDVGLMKANRDLPGEKVPF